jgi:hypothetical protein
VEGYLGQGFLRRELSREIECLLSAFLPFRERKKRSLLHVSVYSPPFDRPPASWHPLPSFAQHVTSFAGMTRRARTRVRLLRNLGPSRFLRTRTSDLLRDLPDSCSLLPFVLGEARFFRPSLIIYLALLFLLLPVLYPPLRHDVSISLVPFRSLPCLPAGTR